MGREVSLHPLHGSLYMVRVRITDANHEPVYESTPVALSDGWRIGEELAKDLKEVVVVQEKLRLSRAGYPVRIRNHFGEGES